MSLKQSKKHLTNVFVDGCKRAGSTAPSEFDGRCNDASRAVIQAMADENGGECWLGRVNLYDPGKPIEWYVAEGIVTQEWADEHEPSNEDVPMWKWSGKVVCNFGAGFVAPRYDATLEKMILDRKNAEYTGTADDFERITAIHERIEKIGGVHLHWT